MIRLRPSRLGRLADLAVPMALLLVLGFGLLCQLLAMSAWPWLWSLPLSMLALRQVHRTSPLLALEWRADGCHGLQADGCWRRLHFAGTTCVSPWVISLSVRVPPAGRRRTVLIWRDSVADATFRRLSRWCR